MSQQSTATAVVPFTYGDTPVRTVLIDGEPWFVLGDLCRILDLAAVGRVAARLEEGVRQTHTLQTAGGAQQMTIVSEAGMYEVVIRSDKPEAVAFRRWITGTVLPEIRKTGSYNTTPAPALTGPELLAHAVIEAQHMLAKKDAEIAELTPKAELANDYLLAQGGARLVREVAKVLGWREKDLRRWLIDEKLVFVKHAPCGAVQYDFYAQFAHSFQTREKVVEHQWGSCTHYTLQILPRGVELIHRRINGTAA
ncbi:antirepressor [Gordonia phage Easley]|uniref:Antirepressor n=1 Tax=Gordonia phage Easley TaxID=2182395 RepID=A0A2U8UN96_9CAUD|nr:anti-repressor Ant [Gordonia phage Easley]AWN05068.1 antirepressor [Gordonia phage Easley]